MSETNFSRRWRTILWLMIGLALLLFTLMSWDVFRWRKKTDDGITQWHRNGIVRLDTNGDGIIDEISTPLSTSNHFEIKRDTDADGVLDLQYELKNGIATGLRKISETAPAQK